jgi:hypothetical protein
MTGGFAAEACETIASSPVRNKKTVHFIHVFIVFSLCQVERVSAKIFPAVVSVRDG